MTYNIKNSLPNIIYENYEWFYVYNPLNYPNDYNNNSLIWYKINIWHKYHMCFIILQFL